MAAIAFGRNELGLRGGLLPPDSTLRFMRFFSSLPLGDGGRELSASDAEISVSSS